MPKNVTSCIHKAGAVKYPCGLIRSYSTSASVLMLQKVLSTSVMRKSYNQLADLQASLSICAVVLIFGWLTNCAERFPAYFCWVSLTASLPEHKWGGWLQSHPPPNILGLKQKPFFFWDPLFSAHLGSKIQTVKTLTNIKRIPSTKEEMPLSGKKNIWEADWNPDIIFGEVCKIWDALFCSQRSQIAGRNTGLEKSSCFQTLHRFSMVYFFLQAEALYNPIHKWIKLH